jgi:hypothetical protein
MNRPMESLVLVNANGEYLSNHETLASSSSSHPTEKTRLRVQLCSGYWRTPTRTTVSNPREQTETPETVAMRDFTATLLQSNPPATAPTSSTTNVSIGTVYHALASILADQNKEALFYDSRLPEFQGVIDNTQILSTLTENEADIITIRFEDLSPIHCMLSVQDVLRSPTLITRVKYLLAQLFADSFDVPLGKVSDMELSLGSLVVGLNGSSLSQNERRNLVNRGPQLAQQFGATVAVHPLFTTCHIDINIFDPLGNKSNFTGTNFEVGPSGNKKTYYQPAGNQQWARFGLKVLGKFSDGDKWLHPFQDQGNWWRAYHGTDRNRFRDIARAAPVDPEAIHPRRTTLGTGVNVSPHLEYAATNSSKVCQISGVSYVVVFQCCVKPGELRREGYPGDRRSDHPAALRRIFESRYSDQTSEWLFESQHVRPYGVLIGRVDTLNPLYGGAIAT